jgi:anaerobic selenocysteine-containing dehydrogenase
MNRREKYADTTQWNVVTGACPHDCPDTCAWQVAVNRTTGQAIDIWGHPDHPITLGHLCGKVDRYLERTYHSKRLTTPLKRVGAKGSGQFVPVSWEEAIGDIATRLKTIVAEHGAESVLPYSYAGTMGYLQGEGVAERFFNKLGASFLARTICAEAGGVGYSYTLGGKVGMDAPDYAHANLILIWGSNTLTSNMHLWTFIKVAQDRGAKVIVIDPAQTRTARAADEWIAIRPGTDGALALAMMHVIINEGLHDADYVNNYAIGFEALRERVQSYSPTWAAGITGISAERITALARDYATTRPAAIRVNYGLQRHYGGGMAMRTITCLPALVGAWREQGGGIQLSTSGAFLLNRDGLFRPELRHHNARTINMNRLGDALSLNPAIRARSLYHPRPADAIPTADDAGSPVHAMIVYNCNPVAVAPDQRAVIEGMKREDLFTVVLEHFHTDTADYADYILPATTQLEHWDLQKPYGHLYMQLNRPAIVPLGEALPNSEIFRRFAVAMGYDEPCFRESDEEILETFVRAQTYPNLATVTWETLLAQGFVRLNVPDPYLPFAKGDFPTPSGKCEFYSAKMADDGYDPLPLWVPPVSYTELQEDSESQGLICISPPAHNFLNSSFVNVERLQLREKEPFLWMHPQDATARGIRDGATVNVSNSAGEVQLQAWITERVIAGTVLAPGIWWAKFSSDGRNINQVTPQDETDMGASAMFYDVVVQVHPVTTPISVSELLQPAK